MAYSRVRFCRVSSTAALFNSERFCITPFQSSVLSRRYSPFLSLLSSSFVFPVLVVLFFCCHICLHELHELHELFAILLHTHNPPARAYLYTHCCQVIYVLFYIFFLKSSCSSCSSCSGLIFRYFHCTNYCTNCRQFMHTRAELHELHEHAPLFVQ